MNIYIVYWIHRSCHTNILVEGYIGVTDNLSNRLKYHINKNQNQHLKRAFDKYDDFTISIITLNWSRSYCDYIEYLLRPEKNIGYNIAIGGGKPPSPKGKIGNRKGKPSPRKGISRTEEEKNKISKTAKGRIAWNKDKTGIYSKESILKNSLAHIGKPPTSGCFKKGHIPWNKKV